MTESNLRWSIGIALTAVVILGFASLRPRETQAQGPYPIVDSIANRVVQKYVSSTCEQLWVKKREHAPPSMEEQNAIGMLRNDPQMRAYFINKIAPPSQTKCSIAG
jgi:hypothetical protein